MKCTNLANDHTECTCTDFAQPPRSSRSSSSRSLQLRCLNCGHYESSHNGRLSPTAIQSIVVSLKKRNRAEGDDLAAIELDAREEVNEGFRPGSASGTGLKRGNHLTVVSLVDVSYVRRLTNDSRPRENQDMFDWARPKLPIARLAGGKSRPLLCCLLVYM